MTLPTVVNNLNRDGWYNKTDDQPSRGARITIADITDLNDVSYRHLLLVEPEAFPPELITVSASSQDGSYGRLYKGRPGESNQSINWVRGAEDLYWERGHQKAHLRLITGRASSPNYPEMPHRPRRF